MKNKEKTYSIALASTFIILFLIFVLPTVSASGGAGYPSYDKDLSDELSTEGKSIVTAAPNFTEIRITNDVSFKDYPVIYGNTIVWVGLNGNWDIFMYDLSTKKETRITNDGSGGKVPASDGPAIYGNRIVWAGHYDIYMYDISTSTKTQITTDASYQLNPAIYGDRIVWYDGRNGGFDIYMYDISTSTETRITNDGLNNVDPAIYEDRIVYSKDGDIYMYNLSTSEETQITNDGSDQIDPDIYGNTIVWTDTPNENYDIYRYDISTSKETRMTNNGSKQLFPAIYGNRIVWEDQRNGYPDVYVYDLATSQESHTTNTSYQGRPDIYSDNIVWIDTRNGINYDIYMGTIITAPPVAAFSASPTSGTAPLNVSFTDNSTGTPTSWMWTFGDGTNSTQQNPMHTYSEAGNYTVELTAANELGSNTTTRTNYIKVVTKPVANFTSNVTSGYAPLSVAFTDNSSGLPTAWNWNFGDGTNSTLQNPTHTYSKAGNYTVGLTAVNELGSNTTKKPSYIKVNPTTIPVANFTSNVTSGYAPVNVAFTDNSTGIPTSWKWTFGDGTNSTLQNPTHTYSKAGNYTVTLVAINSAGSSKITKSSYIKVTLVTRPVANFTSNATSGYAPLNVAFTDNSSGLPTAWNWNFGDGTNSTLQNPTHTYSKVGNYTVTLMAINSAGSSKITKSSYIKVNPATKPVANFTSNVTSGYAPLDVAFTDNSSGLPTAWNWYFGDGMNSTIQNPTHKYSKAGNYTVTLTAINSAGSSKITKSSYIKVNPATKPVANFTSNVTSGYAPLDVAFTDNSSGLPAAWNWTFGDGTNSTIQNPTHTYSKAGNYTVVLTASNLAGSNKITKPSYIKVIKR